ncbi:YlxM family DNA-binding protein [Cetobacterium sp. SF1]|uniref:YlxM family DNA-binding protein n=1 Tax=unclassified Cetobacterium TaxID=2630983 RepID=UPI003CF9F2C8
MELDELIEVSVLLDYYKNLLSDRQKEYLLLHFEEDLSLSEIAKRHSVSRQAVYDNIKRGIKILRDYEDKIGFHKKEQEIYQELIELKKDFTKEKLDKIIEEIF